MSLPVLSVDAAQLLAPYPHVDHCAQCREYADEYLTVPNLPAAVLAAVLDHHDSAHFSDRLSPQAACF